MASLTNKTVFITGGSVGLGREIAKLLAAKGANITIFARRQGPLDEARNEILDERLDDTQEINAVSVDLANASEANIALTSQPRMADILYCVAGGNPTTLGFLADIEPTHIDTCMRNNYYTAAYSAHSMFKLWIEDDKNSECPRLGTPKLRQIVFINSAAAFVGIPGYISYTTAKCAVRGLADTLRMEALRYCCPASTYTVHCAFPSNFISDSFLIEQNLKPDLTKELEGTNGPIEELHQRFPPAAKVASQIIAAVEKGEFAICEDSIDSALLFANMVGPSPKRGLGIVDTLFGVFMNWIYWPYLRRQWEDICRRDRGDHLT